MQVSDIMIDHFAVVPKSASLRQAALSMSEHDTDVLLVEQGMRVVGTLSWRDLALKGYGEGRDPDKDPVAMVMAQKIASCPLDSDLTTALRLMIDQGVDALVLGDPPETAIGLVTRARVLEELADPSKEPHGPTPPQVNRVRGNPI
jgi:predicted transcriptional regulator